MHCPFASTHTKNMFLVGPKYSNNFKRFTCRNLLKNCVTCVPGSLRTWLAIGLLLTLVAPISSDTTDEQCDRSCLGHCRGEGPKGCEICKEGFIWDPDYGCLDLEECHDLGYNPCPRNTFCVNTEGSYVCMECDKSCDGCNGDGPDFCLKCAENFELDNGYCKSTIKKRGDAVADASRYITYAGLAAATCIIFPKNIYIASIIGMAVALYIGAAEYTVRDAPPLNPLESGLDSALKGVLQG